MTKSAIVKILSSALLTSGLTPAAMACKDELRPANRCDPVSDAKWNKIRKGMTLSQVEHLLGCKATHQQTNEFKTFTTDIWNFKTGSRVLVKVHIRDDKLWIKRSMYR